MRKHWKFVTRLKHEKKRCLWLQVTRLWTACLFICEKWSIFPTSTTRPSPSSTARAWVALRWARPWTSMMDWVSPVLVHLVFACIDIVRRVCYEIRVVFGGEGMATPHGHTDEVLWTLHTVLILHHLNPLMVFLVLVQRRGIWRQMVARDGVSIGLVVDWLRLPWYDATVVLYSRCRQIACVILGRSILGILACSLLVGWRTILWLRRRGWMVSRIIDGNISFLGGPRGRRGSHIEAYDIKTLSVEA